MRDIPLWQELIENHYNSSSYTNKLKTKIEKLEKENEKLKERMKETANNYEQISEAYYRLSEGINNAIEEFKTRYPKNAYGEPELGGIACEFSLKNVLEIIKRNIGE